MNLMLYILPLNMEFAINPHGYIFDPLSVVLNGPQLLPGGDWASPNSCPASKLLIYCR